MKYPSPMICQIQLSSKLIDNLPREAHLPGWTRVLGEPALQLYTPAERLRRDRSVWTVVQAVLAPLQFLVFVVSCALVLRFLLSGEGYALATGSVVLKTAVLYAIMVTGSIWEKQVFGRWLFAPAFYWEDVVSMGVIALHTAYLVALFGDLLPPTALALLTLAAYATYCVNAAQFLIKLRMARREGEAGAVPA